jgi:hypothetical protein
VKHASETPADQLIRIAEEVPGFGGMFYDSDGSLNIYLLEPGQAGEADRAVASICGDLAPGQVKVLEGQYGFLQLREWYWQLGKLLRMKGVVFMVIDEARNRVVFGVEKGNALAREHVEQRLARLSVPREAIVVEQTDPVVPFHQSKGVGLH